MARVEEARRAALRRLAVLQPRASRAHRPAALLERGADRLELVDAPREPPRLIGALVRLDGGLVVGPGRLGDAGHVHVQLERADLVAERHEVVARVVLDLGELGRVLAPPLAAADDERRTARARQCEQDQAAGADSAAAVAAVRALDEVEQHGLRALAAVGLRRLRREPAVLLSGAGDDPRAGDHGERDLLADTPVDRACDLLGRRPLGHDGNVHVDAAVGDRLAHLAGVDTGAGGDVDGAALKRFDHRAELVLRRGRRRGDQQQREAQQQGAHASRPASRAAARGPA